jgi:hypothetical protein
MSTNEVWFKHKTGLLVTGMPVHWKGWLVGLVFGAAVLSIVFAVNATRASLSGDELRVLYVVAGAAMLILIAAFAYMAWPHRGKPNGGA